MPVFHVEPAQPAQQLEHLLGPRVGGDVEVAGNLPPAALGRQQRVPHRAAHEVHLEPGRGEASAQLGEDGGEVDQLPHRLLDGRGNRLPGGTTRGSGGHDEPG